VGKPSTTLTRLSRIQTMGAGYVSLRRGQKPCGAVSVQPFRDFKEKEGEMRRFSSCLVLTLLFAFVGVLMSTAQAETPSGRRGFGDARGTLLGLLRLEEVQKELKLSEDQATKVNEISEKLRGEMREQYAVLQDIENMQERRAKTTELSNQLDAKAREQLREVLSREQMMRLFQIRLQVRGAVYALNNTRIAGRLELTDEQKKKVAELDKATQDKITEAYSALSNLSQEERREKMAELREKVSKMRNEAEEKALGLLTAEQKEAFEKMKGEKFEPPARRRQP
jgi:Spy/CpxP family protein refolding chaperone